MAATSLEVRLPSLLRAVRLQSECHFGFQVLHDMWMVSVAAHFSGLALDCHIPVCCEPHAARRMALRSKTKPEHAD